MEQSIPLFWQAYVKASKVCVCVCGAAYSLFYPPPAHLPAIRCPPRSLLVGVCLVTPDV